MHLSIMHWDVDWYFLDDHFRLCLNNLYLRLRGDWRIVQKDWSSLGNWLRCRSEKLLISGSSKLQLLSSSLSRSQSILISGNLQCISVGYLECIFLLFNFSSGFEEIRNRHWHASTKHIKWAQTVL